MKVALSTDENTDVNTAGTITIASLTDRDATVYNITKPDGSAPALTDLVGTKSENVDANFDITLNIASSPVTVSIAAKTADEYPTSQESYTLKAFGYDEVVFNLPKKAEA